MDIRYKYKTILWEILFPLFIYYIVLLAVMYLAIAFLGGSYASYMPAQIIATIVTLPVVYFTSYRVTQKAFVQKPPLSLGTLKNILFIIVIAAAFGFSLNNIISMSPLVELSEGYEQANMGFYGSTMTLELIGAGILTPILEELVFRGIIYNSLKKISKTLTATVISALIFAFVHFNIVQFVYAFLVGMVLAVIMEKSRHVYGAMIGHITANVIAVIRTETGILQNTLDKSIFAWIISVLVLIIGLVLLWFYYKRFNPHSQAEN